MNKLLSSKELAEKYINRRIFIRGVHCPKQKDSNDDFIIDDIKLYPVYITGHYSSIFNSVYIIISFEDSNLNDRCCEINSIIGATVLPHTRLKHPKVRYWTVVIDWLIIEPEKKTTPTLAYPRKCKNCNHPARIISDKLVLCSNAKCKSRIDLKQYIKLHSKKMSPIVKINFVDFEGYPICPTCKTRAITGSSGKYSEYSPPYAKCINRHQWDWKWVKDQKVCYSQCLENSADFIFDGINFVSII